MAQVNAADAVVRDYLATLDQAAGRLPAARRRDLVDQVREHIEAARAEAGDDEASLRNLLDRLGTPEEIVAAEAGSAATDATPRLRAQELAAMVLLPLGGFLVLVGWVVGVVLLWLSDRWSPTQKIVATFVWPFGLLTPLLGIGVSSLMVARVCTGGGSVAPGQPVIEVCESTGPPAWLSLLIAVLALAAPILVTAWLAKTARAGRGHT